MGKTKVSREETVKCTSKADGIGVLACSERFSEDNDGKILLPAEMTTIGKDLV